MAKKEYENALHLYPPPPSGWTPKVVTCSALKRSGLQEIWELVMRYRELTVKNDYFYTKRNEQSLFWMNESIQEKLRLHFNEDEEIINLKNALEQKVLKNKISSFRAAQQLLNKYFEKFGG